VEKVLSMMEMSHLGDALIEPTSGLDERRKSAEKGKAG